MQVGWQRTHEERAQQLTQPTKKARSLAVAANHPAGAVHQAGQRLPVNSLEGGGEGAKGRALLASSGNAGNTSCNLSVREWLVLGEYGSCRARYAPGAPAASAAGFGLVPVERSGNVAKRWDLGPSPPLHRAQRVCFGFASVRQT